MDDADDKESVPDEERADSGTNEGGASPGSSEASEERDRWESDWSTRTATAEDSAADDVTDDNSTDSDSTDGTGARPGDTGTAGTRVQLSEADIREYTTERRSLAPGVQLQWGFGTSIGVLILSSILTGIVAVAGLDPRLGAVILVVLFVLGMAWVSKRYDRWVYQVREDALYLERGVVTHVRTLVPYVRIQHVDTSRGPLERALGLSTLVVYTAGSRGADVSIPGLTPEEASDLQQRVKELAIEAEGGDAL